MIEKIVGKAKSYTAINELTPELLRLFIRIVCRDIGAVNSMEGEIRPYIKPLVKLSGEVTVDGIPV